MTARSITPREVQWAYFLEAQHSGSRECIVWPYSKMGRGYGSIKDMRTGKVMGAHRLACELAHGQPPSTKHQAAHECGNPSCINPNHVRWATAAENAADKKLHGTNNDGERHGLSRLSDSQAADIRKRLASGKRGEQARISRELGVSPMAISTLARGHSYRNA